MVAVTLLAPVAVSAQEEIAVITQEEVAVLAPVAAPAVVSTSGEDGRSSRARAAERALLSGELGSLQEEHLRAIVAAAPAWDETSGYSAVEASRATIGHPAASTTQVPAGVRFAPVRAITPEAPVATRRVLAAQHALASQDLGGLQEDALLAVVAAGSSWDQTSGYRSVEASRATIGHPAVSTTSPQTRVVAAQQALRSPDLGSLQEEALRAVMAAASTTQVPADVRWAPAGTIAPEASRAASRTVRADALPRALSTGRRAESAHLATVALPIHVVRTDSDDRIATALFGDQSIGHGLGEASRATIVQPATTTNSEQTRVLAAQQALLSPDLGSLQEETLTAVVAASSAETATDSDAPSVLSEAELLAQFRAIELALSRNLGAN